MVPSRNPALDRAFLHGSTHCEAVLWGPDHNENQPNSCLATSQNAQVHKAV